MGGSPDWSRDGRYLVYQGDGGEATRDTGEVKPGTVLFVAAGAAHRFHDIQEDLNILVFFSKAR